MRVSRNFVSILTFSVFLTAAFETTVSAGRYKDFKVIKTKILGVHESSVLSQLAFKSGLDFWSLPRNGKNAILLCEPQQAEEIFKELTRLELRPEILTEDVSREIAEERFKIDQINSAKLKVANWENFMTLDEINQYMDEVVANYSNIVSELEIGTTTEGRATRVLHISTGPGKPAIFINGAIHAREWIGPPVAMYAINQLTEFYDQNSAILNSVDFYIAPVVNPDGYVFSWEQDRFWRKTRSLNDLNCLGVDANRNFDWQWAPDNDMCSLVYPGTAPASEPEIQGLQSFLQEHTEITFYVDLHSFGQSMIFPWASSNEQSPMYPELMRVGNEAANALRTVRGTNYTVHSVTNGGTNFLYGVSVDWAYGVLGIPLTYAIELPGGGSGGFDIPPEEILPVATETWEALKVFAQNAQPTTTRLQWFK
ncbi:Hypothetical predicted protein [Cloeon dipterum]|uniref:Peptidase M14 domain-containing protein n=2 Tax=Cloeon dipterum TaxID=197152 RepID=A0A8S1DFQ3_9INSE|nr:Hypothetical predicted protein [Cloeon dipterum]